MDILRKTNPLYPKILREIHDPPVLLYYRGNLERLVDSKCLAVVGSRKPTAYGESVTKRLVSQLSQAGITIISGLAYGIDAISHRAALDNGGQTIAVLGCGLNDDTIYPPSNGRLARDIIAAGGLLLSEYPAGTPALKHHFIQRNRIISGLSRGVLIPECAIKSGALITAKHALEQNRNIYAVPGPINSEMSAGPLHWLKQGAQLITEATDILPDFGISPEKVGSSNKQKTLASLTNQQLQVLQCLQTNKVVSLDAATTAVIMTELEMLGLIERNGNGKYQTLS